MTTRLRQAVRGLLAVGCLSFCSCTADGHFSILGYTTAPNYDASIKTVYVPQAKSLAFRRQVDVEMDLTRAIIREIESKSPFKVISDRERADTELLVTVLDISKRLLNRNQLNEVREAQMIVTAQVAWVDLRTGRCLSQPDPGAMLLPPEPLDPNNPPLEPPIPKVLPVTLTGVGRMVPEVGESFTTALQRAENDLATQIVSMMEKPW